MGQYLCDHFSNRFEVHTSYKNHVCSIQHCPATKLDITSYGLVAETITHVRPSLVVHAAAVSSPDICERDPSRAWSVNVDGTQNLITAAREISARLIYISTDMVFSGQKGNYNENDTPSPVNMYGKTKLEGEMLCRRNSDMCTIVRITLQYGFGKGSARSFSDWILHNLTAGKQVPLFHDQYRTPTYVKDTVRGIEILARQSKPGEIYHIAAPDRIDRYAFGRIFTSVFNFPESLLQRTTIADVPSVAERPKDVSLNGRKFTGSFNFFPKGVYDGITEMHMEYASSG